MTEFKSKYTGTQIDEAIRRVYESALGNNESVGASIGATYTTLKRLRNNSLLVPGRFYRITDYACTTVQEGTRAVENTKFDIIVQALSQNTLSEIALADRRRGTPTLMDSVLNNKVIKSLVTPYYYEYVDSDGSGGLDGDYRQGKDVFVAYDYLENNEGVTVPVIYKTDARGVDPLQPTYDSEYADPDYGDAFYYVGTAVVDGVIYDKWRQIDEDDYTWTSDEQSYIYTNQIVQDGTIELESFLVEEESDKATLRRDKVTVSYREFIDFDTNHYNGIQSEDEKVFADYDYLENNRGELVPVLYELYEDEVVTNEVYYYESKVTIDGEVYDKWRKIEVNNQDYFNWNTVSRAYYYTNVIVEEKFEDTSYEVANFPAWELKYCIDNDSSRFAWADEEDGKGVIYYMKDGHGNECPYDFKNIQFQYDSNWYYTFSFSNENNEIEDLSFKSNVRNNKICNYGTSGYLLNNITMVSAHELEGVPFNCCRDNTFDLGCHDIALGHNCSCNTFEKGCGYIDVLTHGATNIKVSQGVKGTAEGRLELEPTANSSTPIIYRAAAEQEITI